MKPKYGLRAINETGDKTIDVQNIVVPDSAITAGSGTVNMATATGDVTGPSSSTDNAVAAFDLTTGKLIKDGSTVNLLGKQFVQSRTAVPTAAGTTTLTVASNPTQVFTGVTTQTVVLPVVTTLPKAGYGYTIINQSTGALTVNSSGSNLVVTVGPLSSVVLIANKITADTTAAAWDIASQSALGYLVYDATLTQTSTNAPVATVGQNNIGQTMTWAYVSPGVYTVTAGAAAFTANKTQVFIGSNPGGADFAIFTTVRSSTTVIGVRTLGVELGGSAALADDLLTETAIRIVIFP